MTRLTKVIRISTTLFGFSPVHPVQAMALALNRLTRQQAWAAQRLAQHAGQTVRIVVTGVELNWRIDHDGHLTHATDDTTPDVTLEILVEKFDPLSLLDRSRRVDMAQYVHVSGQAALAQLMSDLARDLRPDPEDALSQWIGDIPARRAVLGAKQAFSAFQSLSASLTQNIAEYLSEETDALAAKPAVMALKSTQSQLLAALDHLERRQTHLQHRLQKLERSPGERT